MPGNSPVISVARDVAVVDGKDVATTPWFVNEWFLAFTAFVGANIFQSGFTRWCLMETIVRKLGAKAGA